MSFNNLLCDDANEVLLFVLDNGLVFYVECDVSLYLVVCVVRVKRLLSGEPVHVLVDRTLELLF